MRSLRCTEKILQFETAMKLHTGGARARPAFGRWIAFTLHHQSNRIDDSVMTYIGRVCVSGCEPRAASESQTVGTLPKERWASVRREYMRSVMSKHDASRNCATYGCKHQRTHTRAVAAVCHAIQIRTIANRFRLVYYVSCVCNCVCVWRRDFQHRFDTALFCMITMAHRINSHASTTGEQASASLAS